MTVDNDVMNFKTENKITKVGKFIRKTSLDELPQLFNILKGEMSFIGPRPWIVEYYNNFNAYQKRRVEVLPGITGLAQATGRNNLNIFEKINYDIEYVDNFSFKMDLKVVFKTIKTVLSKEGAELSKYGIKEEIEDLKHQNA
jgi:lipopolysaccharide/colanic/teichoic acid biosynthesis glycosyltransferase